MIKPLSVLALVTLSIFTQLAAVQTVNADELSDCAPKRDTSVQYLRCLDIKITSLDNNITLWGNNIIFKLEKKVKDTGRKDTLHLFKKTQKSFTKYKEHHCRWRYVMRLPDTTAGAVIYKECMVQMSQTRVRLLKQLSGENNQTTLKGFAQ
ncbi:MAG: hypothetical protein ACI9FJ_000185 [Alteromonadaceae bacterium]|jgi:uncharacterized protein YecT (DUF1311 family)